MQYEKKLNALNKKYESLKSDSDARVKVLEDALEYECMYICMYVCMSANTSICTYECMYTSLESFSSSLRALEVDGTIASVDELLLRVDVPAS